ncbi:Uncharacterised protein [Mycobacterium tuberculosis]|nr:Uncharacterised protein [Mycobacterium tuberculosis]
MPDWLTFPWIGPCDISVTVAWDEEYGWSVDRIDENERRFLPGEGRDLIAGRLLAVPVPLLLIWAPDWG